ncbi:DUF4760 domain-containing protein [Jiella sp. MQZ9-1]|nr:DUF4760 domain-containing protein [Jiella flava]
MLFVACVLGIFSVCLIVLAIEFPDLAKRLSPVIGPVTVMVSAAVAFGAAIYTSKRSSAAQRETNRLTETWRAISQKNWDEDYITARTIIIRAYRSQPDLSRFAKPQDLTYEEDFRISRAINNLANDAEAVAIAIANDVIDEGFYKQWFKRSYIADYEIMRSYIDALRSQYDDRWPLYRNFEILKTAWQAEVAEEEASPVTAWYRRGAR